MVRLCCLCVLGFAAVLLAPTARAEEEKPKAKLNEKSNQPLLFALGACTAGYLFESHQKVGVLGDAMAKNVYTVENATRELTVSLNLFHILDRQFAALEKSDLDAADKNQIKQFREIIAQEIKSAEGLKAFWKGKAREDAQTYDANRKEAWEKIQTTLGIKKPAPKKEKDK